MYTCMSLLLLLLYLWRFYIHVILHGILSVIILHIVLIVSILAWYFNNYNACMVICSLIILHGIVTIKFSFSFFGFQLFMLVFVQDHIILRENLASINLF